MASIPMTTDLEVGVKEEEAKNEQEPEKPKQIDIEEVKDLV